MTSSHHTTTNGKTDAGIGSKAVCRVSNILHSPSPEPRSRRGLSNYTPLRTSSRRLWMLSELKLSLRTECAYQPSDQARDREAQSGSAVPPLITQRTECASQPQWPSQQALRAFASSREALLSVRAPLPTSPFSPPPFCTIVAIHHHQCQNTMGSRCQSSWSGYFEPRSP
jgi:hypothetical protein